MPPVSHVEKRRETHTHCVLRLHKQPQHSREASAARTPVYSSAGLPSTSTVAQPEKQPSWSRLLGVGSSATGRCSQVMRSCDFAWPQTRPQRHSGLLGTCW